MYFAIMLAVGTLQVEEAAALDEGTYHLTVSDTGHPSYDLGIAITTVIKMVALPAYALDMDPILTDSEEEQASLLRGSGAEFALMAEPAKQLFAYDAQSLAAFWEDRNHTGPVVQLVVQPDMDDDVVYHVTRTIMENGPHLNVMDQNRSWTIATGQVLAGLSLPLHPGAARYYRELGITELPGDTETPISAKDQSSDNYVDSHLVYFDAGSATLDEAARKELTRVCQDAHAELVDEIRIIPYKPSTDVSAEEQSLERQRSVRLVEAIENSDVCRRLGPLDILLDDTSALPDVVAESVAIGNIIEVTLIKDN